MDTNGVNVLTLAYLGDAIYEIYVREHLIRKGICKVNELQKYATEYVSAKGQASFLKNLLENHFLTEKEESIVYRARNHKVSHKPKSTDIVTYKYATGLEALIGYLYLEKENVRIDEIMDQLLGE